ISVAVGESDTMRCGEFAGSVVVEPAGTAVGLELLPHAASASVSAAAPMKGIRKRMWPPSGRGVVRRTEACHGEQPFLESWVRHRNRRRPGSSGGPDITVAGQRRVLTGFAAVSVRPEDTASENSVGVLARALTFGRVHRDFRP